MKRYLLTFCTIAFFLLMLLFPQTVFQGASNGLLLWFNTILPTLLPFVIVSNLLLSTHGIDWIARIISPVICRIFHVSYYGSTAVLTGFLCGYPMGSKITSDLLKAGYIDRFEGQYLLSFCNNTSPMFIISYLVWQTFGRTEYTVPSLLILTLAPAVCSIIFRRYHKIPDLTFSPPQKKSSDYTGSILDSCIMNGAETITKVGGYIMLFSILLSLAGLLPVRHPLLSFFLFPSLEITNGIFLYGSSSISFDASFICCLSLTSFGGWCSVAQTRSMIQGTGLRILPYIIEKLVTAAVTSLFAFLYTLLF